MIACVASIVDAMVAVGVDCHLELFVEICIYIFVLYIELYIIAKAESIRPLIIMYAGVLNLNNAKMTFVAISMKNVVEERAFSIIELRSCFADTPKVRTAVIPMVMNEAVAMKFL